MRAISWNCQGIGNPRLARALHEMVRRWKPEIVFLMETICDHKAMENIRVKLGFDSKLVVDREGNSGGLCLF